MKSELLIDVHTHAIPAFYREAMIAAGYPTKNGTELFVDGFRVPSFTIESYVENRAKHGYDYSIMSISAPGISFLKGGSQAPPLARKLNQQMFEWTQTYPECLGAFSTLPLPDIKSSLEEIRYCLDELKFEGVVLFTNYEGIYLGDPKWKPILEELNRRKAVVFVHPTTPTPQTKLDGVSAPVIEYTFDTTRTITSLLFTGTRKQYPDMKMIFSHGGGVLPFMAHRLGLQSTLPFHGGRSYDESLTELKGYYYDLAVSGSAPQLAALNALVGSGKLLAGSDYPFLPEHMIPNEQKAVATYAGFSEEDRKKIKYGNALELFPGIKAKLLRE